MRSGNIFASAIPANITGVMNKMKKGISRILGL
jgi:hypothetical protein